MKNLIYFWKRFLLPHLSLFVLVLCTGMVAAAASQKIAKNNACAAEEVLQTKQNLDSN